MSLVDEPKVVLEWAGNEYPEPSEEDIARALAGPRDDDWIVTLYRGDEDYMEAMLDQGALWLECYSGDKFLQAQSHVEDDAARKMMVAFARGEESWRDLAAWRDPPATPKGKPPPHVLVAIGVGVTLVILLVGAALVTGNGVWVGLLFALSFPGIIAVAMAVKQAQAKRASTWTKGTARILTSEMVTEKRHDRELRVPRVEYEYTVGFHPFRGRRVDFAEIVTGPEAVATLKKYPVGASVPVYYDPKEPGRSVLDRDLPSFFKPAWFVVAGLAILILAVGMWLILG